MELTLAENIRRYRKDRKLTQEQLSEILGVTAGAVYKWEAGLSVPEIDMLVKLADFFDSSVDALLGYRMNDSRLNSVISRIQTYTAARDHRAIEEAEAAMRKYPNSFDLVIVAAYVYYAYGIPSRNSSMLNRALELMEQTLALMPQNTDPKIGEQTIYGAMAEIYFLLGQKEKGVELYRKHNEGGRFNSAIGFHLAAEMDRAAEAETFLSSAFLSTIADLVTCVMGYAAAFLKTGRCSEAVSIINWALDSLEGIKKEGVPDLTDKVYAEMLVMLSGAEKMSGEEDRAGKTMRRAASLALRFDGAPDYSLSGIRFISAKDAFYVIDLVGDTAVKGAESILGYINDPGVTAMWEEAIGNVGE